MHSSSLLFLLLLLLSLSLLIKTISSSSSSFSATSHPISHQRKSKPIRLQKNKDKKKKKNTAAHKIRLTKKKDKFKENDADDQYEDRSKHRTAPQLDTLYNNVDLTPPSIPSSSTDSTSTLIDSTNAKEQSTNNETDFARITIVHPPNFGTIQSSTFSVNLQISCVNYTLFAQSYNTSTSKVCVSLDDSPYACWPAFGAKIKFVNAIEGPHSLHAVLVNNGTVVVESITEDVLFTTIDDGDLDDEESDDDIINATEETITDGDNSTIVRMDVPRLEIVHPLEKITLPGSSVHISTTTHITSNETIFKQYFAYQMVCYNLDVSTASPCWSLFNLTALPWMTNLDPGLHTLQGVLTHPDTGRAIKETQTPILTFFTSGDDNEAAAVLIEIDIDGVKNELPVNSGSDALNMGRWFCGVNNIGDERCIESVKDAIVERWKVMRTGRDNASIIEM